MKVYTKDLAKREALALNRGVLSEKEIEEIIDPINHPPHYNFGRIEVLDAIIDWKLSYLLSNVIKYVARAEHKGHYIEDLKKAQFYLNRQIKETENAQGHE